MNVVRCRSFDATSVSAKRDARNARDRAHTDDVDDDAMARRCVDVDVSTETVRRARDGARARAVVDAAVRGGSETAVLGRRRAL